MNKMVKNVFLFIMGLMVAFVLYILFFGVTNWDGDTITTSGYGRAKTDGVWMGLIFYMSAAVETNMSRYYNQYCYIPSALKYMDVDKELLYANTTDSLTTTSSIVNDSEKWVKTIYKNDILPSATAHANLVSKYQSVSVIDSLKNDKPIEIDVHASGSNLLTDDTYYTTDWY